MFWKLTTIALLLSAMVCRSATDRLALVDDAGVLRWQDDGSEVALLGINYYAPFTIDFHELEQLNLNHRQVIQDDVAHFRRLGLGCIRIHCFDRQISDAEGNLLDNIHLELLDLLIDTCRQNGLYTVLTPIAWWDAGVGAHATNGFSDLYTMQQLTTERTTWPIQARFLKQFAEHVNRYTGRRYADDPCVLAFECINEPLYPKDTPDSSVTAYINTLTDALRASGTTKPIFYNSWHNRTQAAGASTADGVSCASYPTGLVAGQELQGPQLSKIKATSLEPDQFIENKARIVYEFDAADMGGSYMYPALAKMFRAEGVQIATQFQYDPMPLADFNRNWKTHYLNLIYTPGKALSLAIAAEVLANVPRNTPYTPAQTELRFLPFRVSVAEELSEMITTTSYLHSNTTRTPPTEPAALERVWGCGSSPIVEYAGSGAYFLDRAAPGIWRLQIYPDVFTIADPYTGSEEIKVKVLPTRHPMTVRLPDLGEAFTIWSVRDPSMKTRAIAENTTFVAAPGDYFLTSTAHTNNWFTHEIQTKLGALAPDFRAPLPASETITPLIRATLVPQWRAGVALELHAEAVLTTNLTACFVSATGRTVEVPMKAQERPPEQFKGTLAGALLTPGIWGVTFRAIGPGGVADYPTDRSSQADWLRQAGEAVPLITLPTESPAAIQNSIQGAEVSIIKDAHASVIRLTVSDCGEGSAAAGYRLPFTPSALGNTNGEHWGLRIVAVAENEAWQLFDQAAWLRVSTWDLPLQRWPLHDDQGRAAMHLGTARFDEQHDSLSLRVPCEAKTFTELWGTDGENALLVIRARAASLQTTGFEVTFIEQDNVAWGTVVPLTQEWQNIRLPLRELRLFTHWDKTMAARAGTHLRLSHLEEISICFGRWLYPEAAAVSHAFEISEISIQP